MGESFVTPAGALGGHFLCPGLAGELLVLLLRSWPKRILSSTWKAIQNPSGYGTWTALPAIVVVYGTTCWCISILLGRTPTAGLLASLPVAVRLGLRCTPTVPLGKFRDRMLWLDAACLVSVVVMAAMGTRTSGLEAPSVFVQLWEALPWTLVTAATCALLLMCVVRMALGRKDRRCWTRRSHLASAGAGVTARLPFTRIPAGTTKEQRWNGDAVCRSQESIQGAGGRFRPREMSAKGTSDPTPAIAGAYGTALRAVKRRKTRPYSHAVRVSQVHMRLAGLQPEQLRSGWQGELREHLDRRGLYLFNAAVRRGSIYISFSLANLWRTHAAADGYNAAAGEGGTAEAGPVGPAAGAACGADPNGGRPDVRVRVETVPEASVLANPDELLSGLGMRREDLPTGFTFTVQATMHDGRCYRACYILQPDGSWRCEPVSCSDLHPASAGDRAGEAGAAEPNHSPINRECMGASREHGSTGRSGLAATAGAGAGCSRAGPEHAPLPDPSSPPLSAPFVCTLHTPLILTGAPDPHSLDGRRQRYELTVQVVPVSGSLCRVSAHEREVFDGRTIEFRARPLSLAGNISEFRVQQVELRCGSTAGEPWSDPGTARGGGSSLRGSSPHGSHTTTAVAAAEAPTSGQQGGCATWALTIWDEALPAAASGVSASPADTAEPYTVGTGSTEVTGTDDVSKGAGARAPHLVDLGLWYGHELLAAREVLLVPGGLRRDGRGGGSDPGHTYEPWVAQLQALLDAQPGDAAQQHVLLDAAMLLSGAFCAVAAARQLPGAGTVDTLAAVDASSMQRQLADHGTGMGQGRRRTQAGQRLLLMLDMGCNLLSLALKHGACALAAQLWASLGRLGFGAEEVLLHAAGMRGDMPPLHAAVASGQPQAVELVLSWYAAASLPEPWLQPVGIHGAPAVLTPLVLASASSPSGALLSYILRNHSQALAAWRVSVGGASGRSTAVAAGFSRVVWMADLRAALSPAVAAVALVMLWWRRWLAGLANARARWTAAPGGRAGREHAGSWSQAGVAGTAAASMREMPRLPSPQAPKTPASGVSMMSAGKGLHACPNSQRDLNTFVAQRTRTHILSVQVAIIAFQTLSHLKALFNTFQATCPAAAAASATAKIVPGGWAWPLLLRATGRCAVGRLWWTGVEVAMVAMITAPWGARHYTASCVAAALLRCMFQAFEGSLLPPSGMQASGRQMLLAHLLFTLLTAWSFQPSRRINAVLRLMEGLAASRMYLKYGVTTEPGWAVVQAVLTNGLGWALSAMLRGRAEQALWKQGPQQQQREDHQQQQRKGDLRERPGGSSHRGGLARRHSTLSDGAWADDGVS